MDTTPHQQPGSVAGHGCPVTGRAPLYGEDFRADPAGVCRRLRQEHGPVVPVRLAPGVEAYLLVDRGLIEQVCRDRVVWSRNSGLWPLMAMNGVPAELAEMMRYRPNALFADGREHERLRGAVDDSLAGIDQERLRQMTGELAHSLIDRFADRGRADLVAEYATRLPLLVFNRLFGLPDEQGRWLVEVLQRIWDGRDAERAGADFERYLAGLVQLKRRQPGTDFTSRLMAHPAGLDNVEVLHHLVLIIGAGNAPTATVLATAVVNLLSDAEARRDVVAGSMQVQDAIHQVLWQQSPFKMYPFVYPRHDTVLAGVVIPKGSPVGLGLAAANQHILDELAGPGRAQAAVARPVRGNQAHLAYGVGPHRCPAEQLAHQIVTIGISTLLERLPGLRLEDTSPGHRRSVFEQAPEQVLVTFIPQPAHTAAKGASPWQQQPLSSTPAPTSTAASPGASASRGRWPWSSLRGALRRMR